MQDLVFDFEESQAVLARAENYLDGKNRPGTGNSSVTGSSVKSGMSTDINHLKRNKEDAATYRRWRKKMVCDTLPVNQKDRLEKMLTDITSNLEDIKKEKEAYYKADG